MSEKKITIRLETKNDDRAVENLTREAFWNVYRPGCMEHYVLHCFRTDPAFVPELDLVMELDGALIGHIMYAQPATDNSLLPHYPALCENIIPKRFVHNQGKCTVFTRNRGAFGTKLAYYDG